MAGKRIGVLALQGAVIEHIRVLEQLDCIAISVKKKEQLATLDGLIIPGGESTTIGKLLLEYDFIEIIKQQIKQGLAIFGTCAGLIVLANKIKKSEQPCLNLIDIIVERNAFGRQIESFEKKLNIPVLGSELFPAVFIRAPLILEKGSNVQILASIDKKIVLAREGRILVSAFHPELTTDLRLHQYFLNMI